jgi:3'-5' exoribonuclease
MTDVVIDLNNQPIGSPQDDLGHYSPPERHYIELVRSLSPPFRQLFSVIFDNEDMWKAFASAPSSINGHHSVRGGNLQHSIEVAVQCLCLAQSDLGIIDLDVLTAAALLHDVGKAFEYDTSYSRSQMTPTGKAVGHKSSGFGMVYSALERIDGLTEHQVLALCNCLSCTFSYSYDSRGPACLEAELLLRCDQLSAVTNQYRASRELSGSGAGHGVRLPHMRETPYFTKPKATTQRVWVAPVFPQRPRSISPQGGS